jgi:hypothetical protein
MPQGNEEWYREFEQSHELPQGYDNWGEFWETARQESAGMPEKTSGTYIKKWAERQAERQPGYKETHDDMRREIRKSGKGGDRPAPSPAWERRYRERTERQKKELRDHIKNKGQGHRVMRGPDPPNPEWVLEGGRYADNNKIGDILSEMEARGAASLSTEEFIDQVMLEVEQSGYQASADEIIDKYYQEYVGEDEQSFDEDAASEIDKKLVRPAERELDTTMRRIERGIPDVLGKVPLVGDSLKKHATKAIAKDPLPKSDRYSQGWEDASLDAEEREAASGDEFLEGSGSGRTKDFRGDGQGDPGAREGMGSEGYQGDALREAARKLMPERGGFWSDMIGSISPEVMAAKEGLYMATEPQGPDIQPMDQREKDAQAIKRQTQGRFDATPDELRESFQRTQRHKREGYGGDDEHFGYHPDDFPDGPPRPDNIDYDPMAELDHVGHLYPDRKKRILELETELEDMDHPDYDPFDLDPDRRELIEGELRYLRGDDDPDFMRVTDPGQTGMEEGVPVSKEKRRELADEFGEDEIKYSYDNPFSGEEPQRVSDEFEQAYDEGVKQGLDPNSPEFWDWMVERQDNLKRRSDKVGFQRSPREPDVKPLRKKKIGFTESKAQRAGRKEQERLSKGDR